MMDSKVNDGKPTVTVFTSFSGDGGVERMIVNLCEGFLLNGYAVNLLLARAESKHLAALPDGVNVIKLPCSHTITSLPYLIRYLKKEKPAALLTAKHRSNQLAVLAKKLAGVDTRLVARVDTTISAALAAKGGFRKLLWYPMMSYFYRQMNDIVAVSQGVANDVSRITKIPVKKITVIPNPVIFEKMFAMAEESIDHPWLQNPSMPVILGIGRLTQQKDFHTLLRAFAMVRETRHCRLIILGEGNDRLSLQSLADELQVSADVDLHGFVSNPYAYLKCGNLFVLSSRWEGSPTVLTEALALGTPVVSTDCPSGPREILDNGKIGALVPMENAELLAEAILNALEHPVDREMLRAAASGYTIDSSSRRHLALLEKK